MKKFKVKFFLNDGSFINNIIYTKGYQRIQDHRVRRKETRLKALVIITIAIHTAEEMKILTPQNGSTYYNNNM